MKSFRPTTLAGPYFKADIPNINIDYKGLTAFARNKECKVCDLTDEEKNILLQMQIWISSGNVQLNCDSYDRQCIGCDRHP